MRFLLIFFVIVLLGCKKDSPEVAASPNIFRADFNLSGEVFSWNVNNAGFLKQVYPSGDTLITVVAGVGNRKFAINIFNMTSGTYQFGQHTITNPQKAIMADFVKDVSGLSGVYYISPSGLSGNITFHVTGNKIKGSFNVTCYRDTESVVISNGFFEGEF